MKSLQEKKRGFCPSARALVQRWAALVHGKEGLAGGDEQCPLTRGGHGGAISVL
jgi:hypothetical protein